MASNPLTIMAHLPGPLSVIFQALPMSLCLNTLLHPRLLFPLFEKAMWETQKGEGKKTHGGC